MIHGQCPHHDSRQKKQQKYWRKENSRIRKTKSTHQFFSITPLFNLLALLNKLNPKSVLMECMFFSPQLFCITFIYLHLYLKSVYLLTLSSLIWYGYSFIQWINKIANWNYIRFFVCCHEVFFYSISKIAFPLFGNRLHITQELR
jgi:hypothetical protein